MTNCGSDKSLVEKGDKGSMGTKTPVVPGFVAGPFFLLVVLFLSLIREGLGFASRFEAHRRWGWGAYWEATGIVSPALIVLGFANAPIRGGLFFGASAIPRGWLGVVPAGQWVFRH